MIVDINVWDHINHEYPLSFVSFYDKVDDTVPKKEDKVRDTKLYLTYGIWYYS